MDELEQQRVGDVTERSIGVVLVTYFWADTRCKEPPGSRERLLQ